MGLRHVPRTGWRQRGSGRRSSTWSPSTSTTGPPIARAHHTRVREARGPGGSEGESERGQADVLEVGQAHPHVAQRRISITRLRRMMPLATPRAVMPSEAAARVRRTARSPRRERRSREAARDHGGADRLSPSMIARSGAIRATRERGAAVAQPSSVCAYTKSTAASASSPAERASSRITRRKASIPSRTRRFCSATPSRAVAWT